ncbi:hypothetical protein DRN02_010820 [Sphingomonas paucimobilis]|nr:hypothetical protein DRN02_010820 [Sphingomonas paucimobilis]
MLLVWSAARHDPAGRSRFAVTESGDPVAASADDPLVPELIRCRALPANAVDPGCTAAWEANRRRFFGETRAMRVPGEPTPRYVPIPVVPVPQTPPAPRVSAETGER